jgi:hypothetical protein
VCQGSDYRELCTHRLSIASSSSWRAWRAWRCRNRACVTGFRCSPSCARIASRASLYLALSKRDRGLLRVCRLKEMSVTGFRLLLRRRRLCALAPASVWRSTEMSVSGFRSSRAVHASPRRAWRAWRCGNRASIALLRVWRVTEMSVSKCVRVPIIAELCTHRLSIASSSFCGELLVVATEPEPLRV